MKNTTIESKEIKEENHVTVMGKVVNCTRLNVREKPDPTSNVVGYLINNETVVIKSIANESFYQVLEGYVNKDFIKII